jgi:general secretion pathway protein D
VKFARTLVLCFLAALVCWSADLAENLYKAGLRAEKAGDTLHAYLLFARAAQLEPSNSTYVAKSTELRLAANMSAHTDLGSLPPIEADTPSSTLAARDILEARQALPPPRLEPSTEKKSFNLRGDARAIFEQVAKEYGIQVSFEGDYQSPPQFAFQLDNVTFEEAMRGLECVSNSFLVPVNAKLALVARDNPAKRTADMPEMSAAIPIPERMTAQDAQEMINAVKQTLDIRRAVVDPTNHVAYLRDQTPKIWAAKQLFAQLSQIRSQVEVDVELLSVSKTSTLAYGMQLPFPLSLVNFSGATPLNMAFRNLTSAMTPYGLGIAQASVFATLSRASATTLLDSQIVGVDGQAATLHVGERYPIATNQYVGSTAGQTGTVFTPPPTVNFEDLGLILKVTPSVHEGGSVTLDVDAEYKTLGAVSPVAGIPIIENNKYAAKVRLEEGEWAVIAGLVQVTDSDSKNGVPGLADIPVIGRIFSQNNIEHDHSEVLIVLKPHVTTLPPWETPPRSIWVGTDSRPLSIY